MKTWKEAIGQEKVQPYFQHILRQVQEARNAGKVVFPPIEDIFTAFKLTEFDQVKVVILGQDPYHRPNQAHGLAFSVRRGCNHHLRYKIFIKPCQMIFLILSSLITMVT